MRFTARARFLSCRCGYFNEVLQELKHFNVDCKKIRKRSDVLRSYFWIVFGINIVFITYFLFWTDGLILDLIAPFGSLIHIGNGTLTVLKYLYLAIHIYLTASWILCKTLTLLLTLIYHEEFNYLTREFKSAVTSCTLLTPELFETYRFETSYFGTIPLARQIDLQACPMPQP